MNRNGDEILWERNLSSCLKSVMPLNEPCVLQLQQFIEYYEFLSFEQWEKSIEDILEEITAYGEKCASLATLQEYILRCLTRHQNRAKGRVSQNISRDTGNLSRFLC